MIKLRNYTPEVYYNESRDFQFIGRLFDIVLNSIKTEADLLYNIPLSDNSDEKLLELFALTVGFKANKKYNAKQLRAICKIFPTITKNKGSIKAIQLACNALFSANGSEQVLNYDFTEGKDKTDLNLYIPEDFEDLALLNNLLSYILPAGMSCNIIKELQYKTASLLEISIDDILSFYTAGSTGSTSALDEYKYFYDNNQLSIIPRFTEKEGEATDKLTGTLSTNDAILASIKDNFGFIANSGVYNPEKSKILPTKVKKGGTK